MNRRQFLTTVGTAAAAMATRSLEGQVAAPAARKPNVIVIVLDDLGYADLGCQGSRDLFTPNIDSIAHNGVRFTNGYVSCPVCSPTRAGMLTGRYQERFGHEFNPNWAENAESYEGLPLTERTLADEFKAAGYATGMVGKWHLGAAPKFHPQKRGFDEFYGFLHGMHDYDSPQLETNNPIMRGTSPVDEKEYLTDAFTREALGFIDRHQKNPFFLYLPYNAVHLPMEVPQKYRDRCLHIRNLKRRKLAAMLTAVDDGVGALLGKLRGLHLEENTLIFCLSDNGGPTPVNTSRNNPLSGMKADLYDGAIRVPFLCQWKGHLPRATVFDEPVIALDIFPTALAAAGVKPSRNRSLDGVDLLPLLTSQTYAPPHNMLFWRYGELAAIRKGNMKLLRIAGRADQLFDLGPDIAEEHDLATKQPAIARELGAALSRWTAQLPKPLWTEPPRKRDRQPHHVG